MRLPGVLLSLTLISSCAAEGVSGIYIAADEEEADIIHIVEGETGQLNGQFEFIEITKRNEVEASSRKLTGTNSKGEIAITIEAPIVDWFSSTTFTGSVSRGTLTLSYSGGTAVYRKATPKQREWILARISQTATKRAKKEVADRAQNSVTSLANLVETLEQRNSDDIEWFSAKKEEFSELFAEADSLKARWRADRQRRADETVLIATENAHFEVEKQVWKIDETVKLRVSAIRGIRVGIDKELKQLEETCPVSGAKQFPALCKKVDMLKARYEATITESRAAFDMLVSFRQTAKI